MARSIGSTFSTQLSSSTTRPFYAIEFLYTQPLRFWTGYGDFVIEGQTYVGSGSLITVDSIQESGETKANGCKIIATGIDTSVLATALTQIQQGVVVNVKFGVLTTSGNAQAIVDTPYEIFSGFVDVVSISEQGTLSTIEFSLENKLIALEKPLDHRYTDQDQKFHFPNDKGLEFVDDLQQKDLVWGGGDQ